MQSKLNLLRHCKLDMTYVRVPFLALKISYSEAVCNRTIGTMECK